MKRFLLLAAGPCAALVLLAGPHFLYFNRSPSVPLGLYLASSRPPLRGSLVAACLPPELAAYARRRGYVYSRGACPKGSAAILKSLAGVAGDAVSFAPDGVLINGVLLRSSRRLPTDSSNRPHALAPLPEGPIPQGAVWLHASHPRSWDSRYYGALPATCIKTTLLPLLVW